MNNKIILQNKFALQYYTYTFRRIDELLIKFILTDVMHFDRHN